MSGNDPWLLTAWGSRAGASGGLGKGCWRGATAANGVKPTSTSLSGWGRRPGQGVHAGRGFGAGGRPARLLRRPCYSYSKSLALASGS